MSPNELGRCRLDGCGAPMSYLDENRLICRLCGYVDESEDFDAGQAFGQLFRPHSHLTTIKDASNLYMRSFQVELKKTLAVYCRTLHLEEFEIRAAELVTQFRLVEKKMLGKKGIYLTLAVLYFLANHKGERVKFKHFKRIDPTTETEKVGKIYKEIKDSPLFNSSDRNLSESGVPLPKVPIAETITKRLRVYTRFKTNLPEKLRNMEFSALQRFKEYALDMQNLLEKCSCELNYELESDEGTLFMLTAFAYCKLTPKFDFACKLSHTMEYPISAGRTMGKYQNLLVELAKSVGFSNAHRKTIFHLIPALALMNSTSDLPKLPVPEPPPEETRRSFKLTKIAHERLNGEKRDVTKELEADELLEMLLRLKGLINKIPLEEVQRMDCPQIEARLKEINYKHNPVSTSTELTEADLTTREEATFLKPGYEKAKEQIEAFNRELENEELEVEDQPKFKFIKRRRRI